MLNNKTSAFLEWFNGLNQVDQSDVIDLVYGEFKVRGLVDGFKQLSASQRNLLFDRLHVPREVCDNLFEP